MERKTIVITGSTRGIGFGLSREFLKRGHQVVLHGRNEDSLGRAMTELRKWGATIAGAAGDIRDVDTFQKLSGLATSHFGKIDIWINNAGVPQAHRYFSEKSLMWKVLAVTEE